MSDPEYSHKEFSDSNKLHQKQLKARTGYKEEIKEIDYGKDSSENIEFEDLSEEYDVDPIESSSSGPEGYKRKKVELGQQISTHQSQQLSNRKRSHYSDGEINIANELMFSEKPMSKRQKVSLEDLKDNKYIVEKCMFCFVKAKLLDKENANKEGKKMKPHRKSIFDNDSSSHSSIDIREIQRKYQDLSNDEIKSSIDNDLYRRGIDSNL